MYKCNIFERKQIERLSLDGNELIVVRSATCRIQNSVLLATPAAVK